MMNSVEESNKLFGLVKDLSQTETNEIELMLSIMKKNLAEAVNSHVESLSAEFSSKCELYGKNEETLLNVKDEIIGGYEKEFYKIKETIEEQYINLIFELQSIQTSEKEAIVDYKKILDSRHTEYDGPEDVIKTEQILDKYGNYCGLENECYKMLEECTDSINYLVGSAMKFEDNQMSLTYKKGLVAKVSYMFCKMFGLNKFEREYLERKRATIEKVKINTDNLVEEIRNNTVNYVDALASYRNQIKEAENDEE